MTQLEYLEFLQHLKAQREAADAKKRKVYHCTVCQKNFSSENAFKQHCESGKHASAMEARAVQQQTQTGNSLTAMNRGVLGDKHSAQFVKKQAQSVQEIQDAQKAQKLWDRHGDTGDVLVVTEASMPVEPKERLPAFLAPEEYETFRGLLAQLEELGDEEQDALIKKEIFDKREPFVQYRCLFCQEVPSSMEETLKHLYDAHSFRLPMVDYVADVEAFYKELQKQVAVARCCIQCLKGFHSVEKCQAHMRNTGHTVVQPERFVQDFQDYYDFSKSYPAEMLKLAQQIGDQEMLDDVRKNRYYVRLEDLTYMIEGDEVTYQEWKEWKKCHVPEWLKVRQQQMQLLGNLRSLHGKVFQKASTASSAQEASVTDTRIQLKAEAQEIVDQVNKLGAALAAKGCKDVIQITADNAAQFLAVEAVPRPAEIKEAARNKYDTQVFENERLNHDKPFFKRSTLHIYN